MAATTLDIDCAWELVLSAVNRSNVTLPLPGTDTEAVKLNGLRVDFASRTYNQRAWWQWWGSGDQYIEVPNSDQTDMSNLVYTTLNN